MLELIGIAALAIFMHIVNTPDGPQQLVVLLAEDDGSTGSVVVSSGGQEQQLDQAGQATRFGAEAPATPFAISQDQIAVVFGDAIGAQPTLPAKFLLYFEHNSNQLVPASAAALPQILEEIAQRPVPEIVIIGHTDTRGAQQYNHQMGFQRAQVIYDAIVRIGADPERIRIESHGESNLLVPTEDEVLEARNRRVEVSVR